MISKPRALVISDLYPNRVWPAFGIFIERQTYYLREYCDLTVVAPLRVFPPLQIWRNWRELPKFKSAWSKWLADIKGIPAQDLINGVPVYYPRYTSPPRLFIHASWGYFAYPFTRRLLMRLNRQRFDLIHAHYATPAGTIALLANHWMKVPVILSIHGSEVTYTAYQNVIGRKIVENVFRKVDILIANSNWTAHQIHQIKACDVEIVRYGGDISGKIVTDQVREQNDTINLLTVGYLEERKGHAYVLKAIKRLVDQGYKIHYCIVGNGSRQIDLEAQTRELELTTCVSFEGYKSHPEVWTYFNDCDIFVLPSWNEAFGIVYIEALHAGKPVIGCQGQGGPEDLIALGECIELVKERDVESLAAAIKRLIDNPERRAKMGKLGREIVQQHFTWEANARRTFDIYQRFLS
jgi:teichuronic acid biosynthesis glycosyltransferase TuaC